MKLSASRVTVVAILFVTLVLVVPSLIPSPDARPTDSDISATVPPGPEHPQGRDELPLPVASGEPEANPQTALQLEPFTCRTRRAELYVPRDTAVTPKRTPSGATCCTPVRDDIDKGLTMFHLLTRYLCAAHPSPYRLAAAGAAVPGGGDSAVASRDGAPRRVRVLQIGANSGDNANDHLYRFLSKRHWAEAVLLEPVPWLFQQLKTAYRDLQADGTVTLVNAAVGNHSGSVPFWAPLADAPGWVRQMGGFSITPKNLQQLRKKRMLHYMRKTSVSVLSMNRVLTAARPSWRGQFPHVVVIDTEGFDAHVVNMLLDVVNATANGGDAGSSGHQRHSPRPLDGTYPAIIQYEWKHVPDADDLRLAERLERMGYCTMRVHYDRLAYHGPSMEQAGGRPLECEVGFDVSLGTAAAAAVAATAVASSP